VALTRLYVLVFAGHGTAGCTSASPPTRRVTGRRSRPATWPSTSASGSRASVFWSVTAARNFTASFDAVFQAAGTTILRTAVQAPRMNAICEGLIGTLRRELPGRTLILNQAHLRAVLAGYQEHYNTARPHQGIDQRVPGTEAGPRVTAQTSARVRSAENRSSAA
jgi:putative transposase